MFIDVLIVLPSYSIQFARLDLHVSNWIIRFALELFSRELGPELTCDRHFYTENICAISKKPVYLIHRGIHQSGRSWFYSLCRVDFEAESL
ncbi:hypothetical protein BD410DRAFT_489492 [Rickenella mellea]|uniref:Uncharacterized protein n=1 Tax=Rickenella mellea TaxID=50990 RepID=A0A4Y7PTC0_9AGAM|nr:hypothetical protein BD410DRAFT_489492 [Rickenella mellea]